MRDSHVSAVITDNVSNMTGALDGIECNHLPLFAHTLQLAVNIGLDGICLFCLEDWWDISNTVL